MKAVWTAAKRGVAAGAYRLNAPNIARGALPRGLTALLYHRIDDPRASDFTGLRNIVNATPALFAQHLDFLKEKTSVVDLDAVAAWLRGDRDLPRHAMLITFDDGYRDNYTRALPMLEERGLPATLFATTGFIDGALWPLWDRAAAAFQGSPLQEAEIPLLGRQRLGSPEQRDGLASAFVNAAKKMTTGAAQTALTQTLAALEAAPAPMPPQGLFMSWDELRDMARRGVSVGAHTLTHPILTRTRSDQARREIVESKARLEAELSLPIKTFAYPNGDGGPEHEAMLEAAGYDIAFLADGGMTFRSESRSRPLRLRRVSVSARDDAPRFALKASGLGRFAPT